MHVDINEIIEKNLKNNMTGAKFGNYISNRYSKSIKNGIN